MANDEVTVRPIDFARDVAPLCSFLGERDRMRLEHCEAACQAGDCFVYVAETDGLAVGWAVVHIKFREDQDWDPPDDDTRAFQQGDNAYLENIEVTARLRSSGVGAMLLEAAQAEAKRRGKRGCTCTRAKTTRAHSLLTARDGCDRTVYPPWKTTSRTRIIAGPLTRRARRHHAKAVFRPPLPRVSSS
jgi:GNAT superfamily N-acetyltransferase